MGFGRRTKNVARAAAGRREEVARLLADFGLARGPRRLSGGAQAREERGARRLRAALESLGGVFPCFGLYLATRPDLLPAEGCGALSAISDRAAPLPARAVRDLLTRELGRPPEEIFRALEESPFESRLLYQKHRALLADGQAVTVKLLRPGAREYLSGDAELLPLLKPALGEAAPAAALDRAVEDFRLALRQKADLLREAAALDALAWDAEAFGMLRAPSAHRSLCTARVLTVERLPGAGLSELLAPARGAEEQQGAFVEAAERGDLARRLSVVWLRQALLGSIFPAELSPEDVTVLPNNQIAFTGGLFAGLPPESRANLWGYLVAAACEDTNHACTYLMSELDDEETSEAGELRRRFRQLMPFRDGGWGDGDKLAGQLFAQWKLTCDCGYLPRAGLPAFYRGLFTTAELARRLAPDQDAVLHALHDLRLIAGMEKFRALLGPEQFGEQLRSYAALVLDAPQRLDQALTLAAAGGAPARQRAEEARAQQRRKNSSARLTALLLVLGAFVLLQQHAAAGAWADAFKAAAFIALGASVLRAASRA
jgi:ubiquinone biosynthesis protein